MAEASYQKAKAAGSRPSLSELADRPRPASNSPYGMRSSGSSLGELVKWEQQVTRVQEEILPPRGTGVPVTGRNPYNSSRGIYTYGGAFLGNAAKFRAAAGLLGLDPESIIFGGILNALNNVPGFAVQQAMQRVRNYGSLPVFAVWDTSVGISGIKQEPSVLHTTRQTGQALVLDAVVSVPASGWLSEWSQRVTGLGLIRCDEMVTYGPAPAAMKAVSTHAYLGTMKTLVFPPATPWPVIPLRRPTDTPQTWDGGYGQPPPVAPPTAPRLGPVRKKKPGKRTKDKKFKGNVRLLRIMHFINQLTELQDVVDGIWDALPDKYKTKNWQGVTPDQKWRDIYRHVDDVAWDEAFFNVIWGQLVEDMIWARIGVPTKPLGRAYGTNMGVNMLINEGLGDQVSGWTKAAKQFTHDWLWNNLQINSGIAGLSGH